MGNTDEALEYYKRCINNTDDKDLIIEVTDIIDKLQDKISHTLITFGLTKEESMNFKGENRVIALIENDNKVLIAKRSTGDPNVFGKWEFPGGKVQDNEDEKHAIEREIKEEFELLRKWNNKL